MHLRLPEPRPKLALRYHLVLLVAVAIVPIVLFAGWTVRDLGQRQRHSVEQGLQATVRALATAVEREVMASVRSLQVLATSDALTRDDLGAFHAYAVRVLSANDVWYVVALTDARGQILLSSARPFGTPLPWIGDRDYIRQAMQTSRPAVSDLITGRTTGSPNISVAVPVMANGKLRYVLFAGISPQALDRIVAAQKVPADWISGIADRNQVLIARSRESEKFVGRQLVGPLREAARAAIEGTGRYPVLDGPDVYAAWQRTPSLGWTVTLGAPVTTVDVALRRSMRGIAIAGIALAAAGGGLALIWGRRIAGAMSALSSAAGALGRGEAPVTPPSAVAEIEAIGRAMEAAGRTVVERTSQVTASQRQLQRLVDSSPIGIAVGEGDRILDANDALLRMLDYGRDDVRQNRLRWQAVIPPGADPAGAGAVVAAPGEASAPRETEAVRRGGIRVPILLSAVVLDEITGRWASFVLDLTESRRAEAERQLRTAAEAASRAKDEFLAIVSHELRTPLGVVLMSVHTLRSGRLEGDAVERELARIERNTQLQIRLIDDLLDLSRIVAGKLRIRRERVVLGRVVEEAVASLQHAADVKGVKLAAALSPGVTVVGDPARLQQVALNLLSNAVKFTPSGGHVTASVAERGSRAVLAVRDTGRGIEPRLLPYIFEPFHQGAGGEAAGGLGLGLAIVRRLVEAHGGTVCAASPGLGCGSVVTVELPVVPAEPVARWPDSSR